MSILTKVFSPIDRKVAKKGLTSTIKGFINKNNTCFKVKGITSLTKKTLKKRGVILVANHTFESDPLFLLAALKNRPDLYMIVEAGFLGLGKNIDRHLIPVYIGHHREIQELSGWRSRLLNILRKPNILSIEEARKNNIESIKRAAEKIKQGGLVIIFPSAAVKNGKWFCGIGHLMSQVGKDSQAKIVMVHINGPGRIDYLRLIPGLGKILKEIKITFSEVKNIKEHWHDEPKTMAYALEETYNKWVNKSDGL